MRCFNESSEVVVRPVARIDVVVVGDIVPVVTHRLGDRHQPDAPRAEAGGAGGISVVDVVEPRNQSAQISDPISIRIAKGAHEHLIAPPLAPPRLLRPRDAPRPRAPRPLRTRARKNNRRKKCHSIAEAVARPPPPASLFPLRPSVLPSHRRFPRSHTATP